MDNILDSLVEVSLKNPDDFLKVKETLTRIGVPSFKNKTLYQSCHILHKRGKYYIVHFKELFALDGRESSMSDDDLARRNTIATLLEDWGLVSVIDKTKLEPKAQGGSFKVINYNDKHNWTLESKYRIGVKH